METTSSSSYNISTNAAPPGNDSVNYDKYADLKKSLHYMSLIVCSLAFVLGVLGNGVVIWVTGFLMKKTVNTVWFLNLAIADFIFTACLPLTVTDMALDLHRPFSKFMCKLNITLLHLNFFASVYILMMISADRCVSVVWPVWARNHRSVRKASWVSLGVWVVGLILSIPYVVFMDTKTLLVEGITVCLNNFDLSDDYETPYRVRTSAISDALGFVCFLLGFVVPFTVIVSCYSVIIHRLRRNRTLAGQSSRPFKIIAAIIITFFLCRAPFQMIGLVELAIFSAFEQSDTLHNVIIVSIRIANILPFLNSCLNPLLYVFMGQDFKGKVHKSILKALESAFQEKEEARSTSDKKTGESMDRLAADDTEV